MCKTGRNPCRTPVRMLSGMLGGQESAFGVKFTCSRHGSQPAHCICSLSAPLHGSEVQSLRLWQLLTLFIFSQETLTSYCRLWSSFSVSFQGSQLNVAYKVSYFFSLLFESVTVSSKRTVQFWASKHYGWGYCISVKAFLQEHVSISVSHQTWILQKLIYQCAVFAADPK